MGGTLDKCRCTKPSSPKGFVCNICGGLEWRDQPQEPSRPQESSFVNWADEASEGGEKPLDPNDATYEFFSAEPSSPPAAAAHLECKCPDGWNSTIYTHDPTCCPKSMCVCGHEIGIHPCGCSHEGSVASGAPAGTAREFNERELRIQWTNPIHPDEIYQFAEAYATDQVRQARGNWQDWHKLVLDSQEQTRKALAEVEQLRQERDALKKEMTIAENADDAEIASIVGPILREIYGESVELGHYKAAIAAWKHGRTGTLSVMGMFGREREARERVEGALRAAQRYIAALQRNLDEDHTPLELVNEVFASKDAYDKALGLKSSQEEGKL